MYTVLPALKVIGESLFICPEIGICAAEPIGTFRAFVLLSSTHPVIVTVFVDRFDVVSVMYSVSGLSESVFDAESVTSAAYGDVGLLPPVDPPLVLKK
jgi:hypothetical protein